jgi:hypothetical protein
VAVTVGELVVEDEPGLVVVVADVVVVRVVEVVAAGKHCAYPVLLVSGGHYYRRKAR